jgi:hypothetical protein
MAIQHRLQKDTTCHPTRGVEVDNLHRTSKLDAVEGESKACRPPQVRKTIPGKTNENTDFHSFHSNSRSKMVFGHGNAGDLD